MNCLPPHSLTSLYLTVLIMSLVLLFLLRLCIILFLLSIFAIFFGIPSFQRYTEGKTIYIEEKSVYSEEDAPGFVGKLELSQIKGIKDLLSSQ